MSAASRTLGRNPPATTGAFAPLYRGMARMLATTALWYYRRAHDRRQLHDTGLVCTEADLWLRHAMLNNRRWESNNECNRYKL
jgi:hypothetical protein